VLFVVMFTLVPKEQHDIAGQQEAAQKDDSGSNAAAESRIGGGGKGEDEDLD